MARERSSFSLLKRGKVFYVRTWDPERRQYTTARSTGETNRRQAEIKAAQMIRDGFAPVHGQPLAVDYVMERLRESGNSPKYISEGVAMIEKHVIAAPVFARLKLPNVTRGHLNRLKDHLGGKGLTPRTVNRIISLVKAGMAAAYRRGMTEHDLSGRNVIEKAKENLRERGRLTTKEIQQVIAAPEAEDPRYKPYVVTAMLTGARMGELRALTWADVDIDAGIINIRRSYTDTGGITRPKTKKSTREIPILLPVRKALDAIRKTSPYTGKDDFVFFQHRQGRPVPGHFGEKAFKAVMDAAGIATEDRKRRNLVPHSLRHTFTMFSRMYLPDFVTGGMTGHTTSAMIDNYGRAGAEHFRQARDVLNAALSVKPDDETTH